MNPVLMAALISGGINALQGKRGSDLLKSTVRDTAIAYALGPGIAGGDKGISTLAQEGGKQAGNLKNLSEVAKGGATYADQLKALQNTPKDTSFLGKLERGFEAIEKPFMKDGEISNFRLGLGATGLGGAAYAAGLFDQETRQPKYPGYNRFYAADPEMFQPLSGRYGPDYEKYPEGSPYSGMQEGGMANKSDFEKKQSLLNRYKNADAEEKKQIEFEWSNVYYFNPAELKGMQEGGIADVEMMSPDDEMLQFDIEQQKTADGPGIVANLMERFKESVSDPEKVAMKASMRRRPTKIADAPESDMKSVTPTAAEIKTVLPERIKRDFVMKFKQDPDKTAIEYATTMRDKDRLTIADVQRAKETLEQMTNETEMDVGEIEGIMGLMSDAQGQVRVPQAPPPPAAISELMETFRSRAANEPRMQQFNKGDLVDVLPSKLKRDENDTSNYKRTSGKMVTDETGKGSGNKDTMLAQLADGEFVTKAKSVLGAGKAMGGKNKKEQRELGAKFFYTQMSELEKLAESA